MSRKNIWRIVAVTTSALLVFGVGLWLHHILSVSAKTMDVGQDEMYAALIKEDYLGMTLLDILTEGAAKDYHVTQLGVYVLEARENAAAYKAGVRSGDRLVSINGMKITASADFQEEQESTTEGQPLVLTVERMPAEKLVTISIPMWTDGEPALPPED